MKKVLSAIAASLAALMMTVSTSAAEQTDFSAYEIRERFTPVEVYIFTMRRKSS